MASGMGESTMSDRKKPNILKLVEDNQAPEKVLPDDVLEHCKGKYEEIIILGQTADGGANLHMSLDNVNDALIAMDKFKALFYYHQSVGYYEDD